MFTSAFKRLCVNRGRLLESVDGVVSVLGELWDGVPVTIARVRPAPTQRQRLRGPRGGEPGLQHAALFRWERCAQPSNVHNFGKNIQTYCVIIELDKCEHFGH